MSPVLLKENSYGKIADQLGVHVSTINRELKRGGVYTSEYGLDRRSIYLILIYVTFLSSIYAALSKFVRNTFL